MADDYRHDRYHDWHGTPYASDPMPNRRETAVITLIGWTAGACFAGMILGAAYMRASHPAIQALLLVCWLYAAVNLASDAAYLSAALRDAETEENPADA